MQRSLIVLSILFPLLALAVLINTVRTQASPTVPNATFTINSILDATDANPGDGVCETGTGNGICTLRAAVQETNVLPDSDIIMLPPGTYTLTIPGIESLAAEGDLDIRDDLLISGTDASNTIIDGNSLDRVFQIVGQPFIPQTINVTFQHLTIQNGATNFTGGAVVNAGKLLIEDSHIMSNTADSSGGAILNGSSLTINNSKILGNFTNQSGGGISNSELLTVTNSTFSNNVAQLSAGGIGNAGTMWISNTMLNENEALLHGGAFFNSGIAYLESSMISSNLVDRLGGGISNNKTLEIIDSQISNNSATSVSEGAGGIYNEGQLSIIRSAIVSNTTSSNGGGILNLGSQGILNITNSTISHNAASQNGGGIQTELSSQINITNTSIVSNSAANGSGLVNMNSTIGMWNTIVANTSNNNCFGSIDSQGHNLENSNTCNFNSSGDLINTNPLLGVLQNNGGSTLTHALLVGSSAIDAGHNAFCPPKDQRGIFRPQGTACDIGAYELFDGTNSVYLPVVVSQ